MASEFQLIEKIKALSVAKTWDEAKIEWQLQDVVYADDDCYETCLCGHYPIKEVCVIRNKRNGASCNVGNCCVSKFMPCSAEKIFTALKKALKDEEKALNAESILFAYERKIISDWDYSFYLNTWRKRKLSGKQLDNRVRINRLILSRLVRKGSSS